MRMRLTIAKARCAVPAMRNADAIATIKEAPKGIALETLDELKRYAAQIETQAVKNKAMPLGNKTKMTDEERAKLGRLDRKAMKTIERSQRHVGR